MKAFTADGWFGLKIGDRVWDVAACKGVTGLDPRTLRGELVRIGETVYRVRSAETYCVTDATGSDFSLMVDTDVTDSELPQRTGDEPV